MSRVRRIAIATVLGVAATIYWFVARPWHRQWGATHGELQGRLPGDDLVPEPADEVTRAVTVDAPAEDVWPWLILLGQGRGGVIVDAVPGFSASPANADGDHPDDQPLEVGDRVPLVPEVLPVDSALAGPEVAVLDDERALVLQSSPDRPTFSWAFVLEPDDGETRLIARMRARQPGSATSRAGARLLAEPTHFAVERGLLLAIKERSEAERGRQREPQPQLGPAI